MTGRGGVARCSVGEESLNGRRSRSRTSRPGSGWRDDEAGVGVEVGSSERGLEESVGVRCEEGVWVGISGNEPGSGTVLWLSGSSGTGIVALEA